MRLIAHLSSLYQREDEREQMLKIVQSNKEKQRLEKIFNIERDKARNLINQMSADNEIAFREKMRALGLN